MCKNFPDIYEKMKQLHKKKLLDFLDGTYSQAHLQALTSDSNWRQFECGQQIYKKLFGNVDEIISPVFVRMGNGMKSFYSFADENFRATAIYSKNGEIWISGYELPGGKSKKIQGVENSK